MRNSLTQLTKTSTLIATLCLLALSFNAQARLGVGFSNTDNVTSGQSLSALYTMNRGRIQAFFGIYNTNDHFDFAIGGAYKFTIIGDQSAGLHIGPGIAIGSARDDFLFTVYGVIGFHYMIVDHLMLSMDGGPILKVVDGEVDFSVEPMGDQMLGLSIHYFF